MTPQDFCTIGEALRGPNWKRPLAVDLGLDERTVTRYARGENRLPIPLPVRRKLVALLTAHGGTLAQLARGIRLT